jgi:uncharacterized membrane protein YcaP (DUF421 family)
MAPSQYAQGFFGRRTVGVNWLHDAYLRLFGPDGHPTQLTFLQIVLRGLIIFIAGLAMVRVGDRRSLAQKTAFDALFIVLLGSMLSRAINGTGPFLLTIAASVGLMIIHRVCAWLAQRYHPFGKIVKGQNVPLVRAGKIDWEAMRKSLVSKHDLEEDLRLTAKTENISQIELANLERSGDISFIKKQA